MTSSVVEVHLSTTEIHNKFDIRQMIENRSSLIYDYVIN
jgi:hypothetical protein